MSHAPELADLAARHGLTARQRLPLMGLRATDEGGLRIRAADPDPKMRAVSGGENSAYGEALAAGYGAQCASRSSYVQQCLVTPASGSGEPSAEADLPR